ncbi:hypothetical protein [Streptomyces tailanensis]|uniref:hypothetical protein n=1 Tax=Streptomyces tailanensis TaxID=2569858 RepID=UPI00122E4C63|nr:hypothetical protein [Streptomyces tailanensis]
MDVSEVVMRAAGRGENWSWLHSKRVMEELAAHGKLLLNWDWEAEEGWGSIMREGSEEAIISGSFPLCIAISDSPCAQMAMELGCEVIEISSWVTPELCCSREALTHAFGYPVGFSSMDAVKFSAHDLWYATV